MFSFGTGQNQISKVKLKDYNKALNGRQPTVRFVLNLVLFSFIIDYLFSNDFRLKKNIRVDDSSAHRTMRPARYRSTSLQIQRSIVSSLCRMIALAIDQ